MTQTMREAISRSKAVDAPVLNRLGLQVARTVAASARWKASRWTPAPEVTGAIAALERDGFAALPDFLPAADFAEVAETARRVNAAADVAHFTRAQGGNELFMTWRSDVGASDRAVLDRFFLHPTVLALGSAAERLTVDPGGGRCTIQRLVQGGDGHDLEAEIHSDTFHPTHKIWLYLTDVTVDDGPLVYYPGSQHLSVTSLRATYRDSVRGNPRSRRIETAEIAARGIEPKVFTCARNTLVIANTFGYHGRIQGRPPGDRLVLHIELRPDPFRRPARIAADTSRAGQ